MFCYQCQETAKGSGCTLQGVCGKKADTSARMDLLLYATRGNAILNRELRRAGEADREADHQIIDALFTTITNANFDNDSLDRYIRRAIDMKERLIKKVEEKGLK
ncbi:MAG: hydroxylamine reductase, partial [Duncaniella sp.]|nr:hydroxylamine reductase [Duncaniella sp.]